MEAEYRRDTHHSYLVLYETEEKQEESFQTRMFLENTVPGFLSCRRYDIDCREKYFYDISSRQSLAGMLENRFLGRRDLEALLTSLVRALNGLQSYLLDTEGFCLAPEWIFGSPSGSEFLFCYFPGGGFSWKDQLKQLAEYLLPKLEHKSREAVELGYSFYQQVMEDQITALELEQLLAASYGEEEQKEAGEGLLFSPFPDEEKSSRKEKQEKKLPESREALLSAFFEEEEESGEKKQGRTEIQKEKRLSLSVPPALQPLLPLAGGGIGAVLLWYFGYDLPAGILAAAAAAAVLLMKFRRWKKEKEEERDSTMEQYVQVQDWLEEEKEEERLQQKEAEEAGAVREETDENATCLLTSEAVYSRLAKGYLVPESDREGSAVPVNQPVTMIGKNSQMDVVLKGIGVSRIHARILCRGEDCFLTDLNSRNGTRVNGVLLKPEEEKLLSDGDRICFADAEYEWRCYRL